MGEMNPDVVIGGGVAGLAAARSLSRQSRRPVILLERSSRLGGLAATLDWEGCQVDLGPHRIYTILPGIERYILDLLGSEVLRVKRRSSMRLAGKYIDYPVSFGEVLRHLGLWCAGRIGTSYAWSLLTQWSYPPDDQQSYSDYIASRFGNYLYRLLFHDYAIKVWREDPGQLSSDMARTRLAAPNLLASALESIRPTGAAAVTEFLYPQGGIGRLADRMAEEFEVSGGVIRRECEVQALRFENNQVVEIQGMGPEGPFSLAPEQIISTLPLPDLFQVLQPNAPQSVLQSLDSLRFADTILVYTLFDQPQIRPDNWLYFPDPDILFTRTYEVNNFDRANVPQGKSCLCLEVPCRQGDEIWSQSDSDIIERVVSDMRKVDLGDASRLQATCAIRLRHVYPIYYRGYREKLDAVTGYLAQFQNLVSTGRGGMFCYNNSDHSIDMGLLAAEYLLGEHKNETGTGRFYRLRPRYEQYRIVD